MQALMKTLQSGYNVRESDVIKAGIAYENPRQVFEWLNAVFIIHNYKEACGVTGCMAITIDTSLIIAGVDSLPPRLPVG